MPRTPEPAKPKPDTNQAALYAVEASTASKPVTDASDMIADSKLREAYRKLTGKASISSAGQFTLAPGTYKITPDGLQKTTSLAA